MCVVYDTSLSLEDKIKKIKEKHNMVQTKQG